MVRLFLILHVFSLALFGQGSVLRLRNGTEARGELLNPQITVHTPYGSIAVPSISIAQLLLVSGPGNDTLMTASGNRFSGYVTDTLQLKTGNGTVLTAPHSEIERFTAQPPALTNLARFVVLVNGDVLSGQFNLPTITITNAAGRETLSETKIDSLWFAENDPIFNIQLSDGKQVRASLPGFSLQMHLEIGGDFEIPRAWLKRIHWRPGPIPTPEGAPLARGAQAMPPLATRDKMVWVSPGSVILGSPLDEAGRNSDEDPRTQVIISRGFWMARFEVTQAEYSTVMGHNPSTFQGDPQRPVEKVSWHDAIEYCSRITDLARKNGNLPDGYVYRLPTEAEWEYACRAGTTTRFSFGDDPDEHKLRDYGWFAGNGDWSTHPVGQLKPNPWGLYDMHGNVLEWCAGIWNETYPGGQVTDYQGPAEGWLRVARGGSWLYGATLARSANRDDYGAGNRCSDVGFRVVLAEPLRNR